MPLAAAERLRSEVSPETFITERPSVPLRISIGGNVSSFSSQYIRVAGNPTYVLASDNCYMYQNLESHTSISTTFDVSDRAANVAAQDRMVMLAGSKDRVVPGHDALQFKRFPTQGRVAKIK